MLRAMNFLKLSEVNRTTKPTTMTHTEKVIHALKIVIGSYEFAAATGQPRIVYLMNETGGSACPLCSLYETVDMYNVGNCGVCPAGNGTYGSCTFSRNFIWNNEIPDREKALRRAAELRERLKEL